MSRQYFWGLLSVHGKAAVKLAKIWWFMRSVLKDPNIRSYTDEALRTSDDYDRQEMYQPSGPSGGREGAAPRGAQARPRRARAGGGGGVGEDRGSPRQKADVYLARMLDVTHRQLIRAVLIPLV